MNLIQYILLPISAASIIAMPGFWDVVKSVVGRGDQSREILASASVIDSARNSKEMLLRRNKQSTGATTRDISRPSKYPHLHVVKDIALSLEIMFSYLSHEYEHYQNRKAGSPELRIPVLYSTSQEITRESLNRAQLRLAQAIADECIERYVSEMLPLESAPMDRLLPLHQLLQEEWKEELAIYNEDHNAAEFAFLSTDLGATSAESVLQHAFRFHKLAMKHLPIIIARSIAANFLGDDDDLSDSTRSITDAFTGRPIFDRTQSSPAMYPHLYRVARLTRAYRSMLWHCLDEQNQLTGDASDVFKSLSKPQRLGVQNFATQLAITSLKQYLLRLTRDETPQLEAIDTYAFEFRKKWNEELAALQDHENSRRFAFLQVSSPEDHLSQPMLQTFSLYTKGLYTDAIRALSVIMESVIASRIVTDAL